MAWAQTTADVPDLNLLALEGFTQTTAGTTTLVFATYASEHLLRYHFGILPYNIERSMYTYLPKRELTQLDNFDTNRKENQTTSIYHQSTKHRISASIFLGKLLLYPRWWWGIGAIRPRRHDNGDRCSYRYVKLEPKKIQLSLFN